MKRTAAIIVILILAPCVSLADADGLKAKADQAWAARDNTAQALLAIELYDQAAKLDPGDKESRIKLAQATYWALDEMGVELDKDGKLAMYERSIQACNEVIAKDEENVEAWYWLMWDMGSLTMYKGVFSGWNLREAIVATIMVAKGQVDYQYGGVYRYWGRVIFETPGIMSRFLHFSDDDSVWLYDRAIKIEPRYLRNHFYLAETYEKIGKKEEAKKEYRFCIDQPDDALPEIAPENRLYKRLAQERMEKL